MHLIDSQLINPKVIVAMLKPKRNSQSTRKMSPLELAKYQQAVAEEISSKNENVAAARELARRLKAERQGIVDLIRQLRAAREQAGMSLSELERLSGISKPSLSRLENSSGPNPTVLTLLRYAQALGLSIDFNVRQMK